MPRRSAASLATPTSIPRVDGRPAKLTPPSWLSAEESEVFAAIVGSTDPRQLVRSDLPLLGSYCQSFVVARRSARELRENGIVVSGKPSPWVTVREKAIRELVALSGRLRLAPQARSSGDPKTVGRRAHAPVSAYDLLGDDA